VHDLLHHERRAQALDAGQRRQLVVVQALERRQVADRVAALEGYAGEVREADAAYRDWRQAMALAEVSREHLDMLARTAADEHGIAEIQAMAQQARAVREAFREPPG